MPDPVDLAGTAKDVKRELFKVDAKSSYLREMILGISVLRFTTWVVLTGVRIDVCVLELQPSINLFSLVAWSVYWVSRSPSCSVALLTLVACAAR